jgi:hypothetical protein
MMVGLLIHLLIMIKLIASDGEKRMRSRRDLSMTYDAEQEPKRTNCGSSSVCRNRLNAPNECGFLLIRCFHFVSFVIDLHSAVYSAHNRVMSFVIDLHSAVYSAHNLVMSFVIDLHSAVYSAHNRVMSFVIDLHSVYSAHNRVKSLF